MNNVNIFAVRGATQLRDNTKEAMNIHVTELVSKLLLANTIAEDDIISIQFTQTMDLDTANPARELRTIGFSSTALFCSLEPEYEDSLNKTVRVLITYRKSSFEHQPSPVYLHGASVLRPNIK